MGQDTIQASTEASDATGKICTTSVCDSGKTVTSGETPPGLYVIYEQSNTLVRNPDLLNHEPCGQGETQPYCQDPDEGSIG